MGDLQKAVQEYIKAGAHRARNDPATLAEFVRLMFWRKDAQPLEQAANIVDAQKLLAALPGDGDAYAEGFSGVMAQLWAELHTAGGTDGLRKAIKLYVKWGAARARQDPAVLCGFFAQVFWQDDLPVDLQASRLFEAQKLLASLARRKAGDGGADEEGNAFADAVAQVWGAIYNPGQ